MSSAYFHMHIRQVKFKRWLLLLLLFTMMNFLWWQTDGTYAGNNGPTYLAYQAAPLIDLGFWLQPWTVLVFYACGCLALLIGTAPFSINFLQTPVLPVLIFASFSATFWMLIGSYLGRIKMISRVIAGIPRWLPYTAYLVLLCAYVSMIVYVTVGLSRYIPPPCGS